MEYSWRLSAFIFGSPGPDERLLRSEGAGAGPVSHVWAHDPDAGRLLSIIKSASDDLPLSVSRDAFLAAKSGVGAKARRGGGIGAGLGGREMADQLAKGEEFERKAEKKLAGWGIFGSKYDDAAELLDRAANSYKLAKSCEYPDLPLPLSTHPLPNLGRRVIDPDRALILATP